MTAITLRLRQRHNLAAELDRAATRLWWITLEHRLKRESEMPEIGGKKLASDFASMMADVRKAIDESKQEVAGAVRELKSEITQGGKSAALAIRREAAAVREGYGALLGNGAEAEDETLAPAATPALPQANPVPPGGAADPKPF